MRPHLDYPRRGYRQGQENVRLIILLAIFTTTSAAYADSLGRLFFTPEQRLLLDNARRQKVKIEEQSEEQAPEIVSLNGVVKRSDGHTTVWLNNRALSDRHAPGGVTITSQGTASDPVTFTMPQGERAVRLRVGQNLDVTTGQVVEPFDPRAAEMKRTVATKQSETSNKGRSDDAQISTGRTPETNARNLSNSENHLLGTSTGTGNQPPQKGQPPAAKGVVGRPDSQGPPS